MSNSRILPIAGGVLALAVVAAAAGGGIYYWASLPASPSGQTASEHGHEEEPGAAVHIPLTEEAFRNLGLAVGKARLGSHFRYLEMPGMVIEKPGHSDHALAAPVNGVVTRILAVPGQAVRQGDELFQIEVIDEALTEAQLALLNSLSRMEVVDKEIARLEPLVEMQAVQGSRVIELRNERQQLVAQQELRKQELAIRGLSAGQISAITADRKLIGKLTVRVPKFFHTEPPQFEDGAPAGESGAALKTVSAPQSSSAQPEAGGGWDFTVERLEVFPGKAVQRGDDLCHLAYHSSLYIRGEAFENEIDAISALSEQGWTVTTEFGLGEDRLQREGLTVRYVDNHVDESQTFHFYLPLPNEVIQETVDDTGRVFRTWRFKPGQRVHVRIPVEKFDDQIKVYRDAVVTEGPQAFVFRKLDAHDDAHAGHDHEHEHDHAHADGPYLEFEQVAVRLLFADRSYAVIATGGELKAGDTIALNKAYPLYLEAEKLRSGGGGGHGHAH